MIPLGTLSAAQVARRLVGDGLVLRTGPFHVRIHSPLPSVATMLGTLYEDYPLGSDAQYVDFDIRLEQGAGLRRLWRPQVRFIHQGFEPFQPLPADHAPALLEWGMNWCISAQAHQFLILHAAVLERAGRALVMPAPPGSGKSTLCAGLVCRGWRLLSDELALVSLQDGQIHPLVRPVGLKNESIAVIRSFAPDAVLGRPTHGTSKGTVTHMRVPKPHLLRMDERAAPGWVVFPRYVAGAAARFSPRTRAETVLEVARNSFNYALLGQTGFHALGDLVSACVCLDFTYGDLEEAAAVFERMAASPEPR